SSERVRQIRARAEQRVRSVAANAPAPFQALVTSIPRWLGAIVPFDAADDLARRLGAGSASTDVGGLLLWLAGPYQPVRGRGGWGYDEPGAGRAARDHRGRESGDRAAVRVAL